MQDFAERFKNIKKKTYDYPPLYLDDSKIDQGRHVIRVQLPSFKMSLLPFVSPQKKKQELNR